MPEGQLLATALLCVLRPFTCSVAALAGRAPPAPLLGFGNEWAFQSHEDAALNAALARSGSRIGRFPGGTPADYWLWSEGWLNRSSDPSPDARLPERRITVSQLHSYLQATNQSTVLVINQLQTNLSYQLEGIAAHKAAGNPIRYLELGNEMYDATRADVLKAYPQPSDYARRMAEWTAQIKLRFPESLVALVGASVATDERMRLWNQEVLQNSISAQADAATIHLYPGLPPGKVTADRFPDVLAAAFTSFAGYVSYTDETIPARLRLWVTEWGTWGNDDLLNTWLQGLWHAALTLLLPRIARLDIILPYCAVCADRAMPGFFSQYGQVDPANATDARWRPTASGFLYEEIFRAVADAPLVDAVSFSPNPMLDAKVNASETLLALAGLDSTGKQAISLVMLNLGSEPRDVSFGRIAFACVEPHVQMHFPKSAADVILNGLNVTDLGLEQSTLLASQEVHIPSYSVVRIGCDDDRRAQRLPRAGGSPDRALLFA